MSDAADILRRAAAWRDEGHAVALATVIETWGSSPCVVGSLLAISDHGSFEGSVSGGCVESSVVQAAAEVFADGRPRTLQYGVSNDDAWRVGLACGGKLRIYLERLE